MKKRIMIGLLLLLMLLCSACTGRRSVVYETFSETTADSSQEEVGSAETDTKDRKQAAGDSADTGGTEMKEREREKSAEAEEVEYLFVDLCGEVTNPGVYELPVGNRIFHAIRAAGGFTDQAETRCVNQAEVLYDGEKITIYSRKEAEELGGWKQLAEMSAGLQTTDSTGNRKGSGIGYITGVTNGSTESADSVKVNLNQADKSLLMTLSGVGEAKAEAIISYREQNGAFSRVEDVMLVSGIKEKLFEQIRDKITV